MEGNQSELPLLALLLLSGNLLAVLYDLLRPIRRFGRFLKAAADLFFGCAFFALTAYVLLVFDSGRLRGYSLPAVFAGFLLFELLPGRMLRTLFADLLAPLKKRRDERAER